MAEVTLQKVGKLFGETPSVQEADLTVADGELVALLGASGCGKTTLLRLIAGFEQVSGGRIAIGSRTVADDRTHVPVETRNVGIVFQSYALWPHMTVAENVGFPLKIAGVRGHDAKRRIEQALATVGLSGTGDRAPGTLSGGQRQRVALARCLVMQPDVVLLDEPLANLDVHLRATMQDHFRDFHRKSGQTMVYVTHDQGEAMALADRVAVMDRGRLLQVATPEELYHRPATPTVAAFVGNSTVVPVELQGIADEGQRRASVFGIGVTLRSRNDAPHSGPAQAMLRPADLELADAGTADALPVRVARKCYAGGHYLARLVHEHAAASVELPIPEGSPLAEGDAAALRITGGWLIPADDPQP